MAMLRAYLVRSTYEWLSDHSFTPYILVDTECDDVEVPWDFVDEDGKIVLNLSKEAIRDFECSDEGITFRASFSGETMEVNIPVVSIMGLYAQETGQGVYARDYGYGLMVNEGEDDVEIDPASNKAEKITDGHKGGLRLV